MNSIHLCQDQTLSLAALRQHFTEPHHIKLEPSLYIAIQKSVAAINALIDRGDVIYGVNTGFGKLADRKITAENLKVLQQNLILSHAVGVGPALDDATVRLLLLLKIYSLAQGFSGVRELVIEQLIALNNAEMYPQIPQQGSVGASGDLAPLAHLSLSLLDEGDVKYRGKIMTAADAKQKIGLTRVELAPKEGLALINGTQVSTAIALAALFKFENIFAAAMVSGALSVVAASGNVDAFDARIQTVRNQPGQIAVAEQFRQLFADYKAKTDRLQDPYSLRCQPQVMGAALDVLRFVATTLGNEANGVTDNPLIFADDQTLLTGGNFHAEPVAMAADTLALAIAEVGSLSERRIAFLIDGKMSGLNDFLIQEPGINSGFMLAHVTAAALTSENKSKAHPACVDSIPTSANQEDHVSMATFAANRLHSMLDNTAYIIAIELMAAAQGIDLKKRSKDLPPKLKNAYTSIREHATFLAEDRLFNHEIVALADHVKIGKFNHLMDVTLLPSFEDKL